MVTDQRQLTRTFVEMADTLVADFDVVELMQQLVEHCISLLDAADAGLLLGDQRGSLQVVASTSERTRLMELFQLEAQSGPCLDAYSTGARVLADDLSKEADRWPAFVEHALAEGFRSVHAVPLRLRDIRIGALGLFHNEEGAMPAGEVDVAQALADIATIGILHHRAAHQSAALTEELQTALNGRVVIEQAKGVLAESGSIEMSEAFRRLRAYARTNETRLIDVAHGVVDGSTSVRDVLLAQTADNAT